MVAAVEKVRERLRRAGAALDLAEIPYAVVGGNAVAAWVATVDEAAVRNTQDVDVLLRRSDLEDAKRALSVSGFVYRHAAGIDMFLDGPEAKARDAVHVVFAEEKVRPEYALPTPSLEESERLGEITVLKLQALVRMKLTSYRRKDQVHILDLIEMGLVDQQTVPLLPLELGERLQALIDDPDG